MSEGMSVKCYLPVILFYSLNGCFSGESGLASFASVFFFYLFWAKAVDK